MNAPSSRNAVLSAINGVCSHTWLRNAHSGRLCATAVARLPASRPGVFAATSDSSGAKRPFRITMRASVSGNRTRAISCAALVGCFSASRNPASAIGAAFVKRHASWRTVGNPAAANREAARSRSSRSQTGAAAPRPFMNRACSASTPSRRSATGDMLSPSLPQFRASRSPFPRARARARARRSGPAVPRSTRARSRARCSSAAAGSG